MGWLRVPAHDAAATHRGAGRPAHPAVEETDFPPVDVFETPAELVVEAELPGVDPARIAVVVGEGLVVIEGTKDEEPDPGRGSYLCMERFFGAFRRVVLPGLAVDFGRAAATYRGGLLQVRLPKIEEKRGRFLTVPVRAADGGERGVP